MFTSRFFASSFVSKLIVGACLTVALPLSISCGGNSPNCGATGLNVGPATATVSHTAAAPANGQMFSAIFQFNQAKAQNGCVASAVAALVNSNWTASDPSVHLSSSPTTQVTATCTAALTNPVTITATQASGGTLTGQATLTCN
ncbi:MAG TPA: hypothetical protein VKH81_06760 [Candidatus Angelobacter sp.]|nr:hypothetical protein [Candidatus Angelobacter sp.]